MRCLLLALMIVFSFSWVAVCAPRKARPTPTASAFRTTLRADRPQALFAGRGAQFETRLISVAVRNIGSSEAKQVLVSLGLEGGLAVPLRGPKVLAPHARAFYSTTFRVPVSMYRNPQVGLRCSSCRN